MAADQVLVPTTGIGIVTAAILGLGATAPAYMGWGVGATAPAAGDTDLDDQTDCGEARTDCTGSDSIVTTTVTNDTYRCTGTITKATAAAIIRELCTFNGAGAGSPPTGDTCFLRAVFDAISLNIGNSIEFTVDTKFAAV